MEKIYNVEKMYTFVRGYCEAKQYSNALKALPYARKMHEGQLRKGGDPYIVHPLGVCLYGINIGLDSDSKITTDLLHDVEEDVPECDLKSLDIEENIKRSLVLLNFKRYSLLAKKDALKIYYAKIAEDEDATYTKLIDRYNNLSTMAQAFSLEKMMDYIEETKNYVYPLLDKAKENYPERRAQTRILKNNIYSLVNSMEGILEYVPEIKRN